MDALDIIPLPNGTIIVSLLLTGTALVHIVPYLLDSYGIRANAIPGPLWAKFTDARLGWVAIKGHRSEVVHAQHQKLGEFDSVKGAVLLALVSAVSLYTSKISWTRVLPLPPTPPSPSHRVTS